MSVLAVDIGGMNVRAAFYSSLSDWENVNTYKMPTHAQPGAPLEISDLVTFLQKSISEEGGSQKVEAIGMSIAGVINPKKGLVHRALNIGWRNLQLKSIIEDHFHVPASIDGDTFCGGIAEAKAGAGETEDTFLFVAIGTGIGHCLILENRIWRGLHNAGNIFGHLKIAAEGAQCYCGGEACVCQYASGEGIKRLGKVHATLGEAINSSKYVVDQASQGVPWAEESLALSTKLLAVSLSHAYTLLDLEYVVLGGGAVSDLWPDLPQLTEEIEKRVYPEVRPIRLARSKFGSSANIVGAAYNAFALIDK